MWAFNPRAPLGAPPSRSASRSFPNGEPQVPRQGWVFPFIAKENPMFPVTLTKVLRPVPTLLGGSGRARASTVQCRMPPALLQPPVALALSSSTC
jgi:hypothetical protein